jgi:hypothetical protein
MVSLPASALAQNIAPNNFTQGGTFGGTFAGNPTFSGAPAFSGGPTGDATALNALASGSSTPRSLGARAGDIVNVLDYGADRTGVNDCSTAVQAAITFAMLTNASVVYFPAGTYWFPRTGNPLSVNVAVGNGLTFRGDGMNASVLHYDEGSTAAGAHYLFYNANSTSPAYGDLTFQDLQFCGTFGTSGNVNQGGTALFLNAFNSIRILNCKFINTTHMATQCEFINYVQVQGNVFENCCRDMCRFRSSSNVIVTGNIFRHGGDDAIALHANYTLNTVGQYREGIIVTNNILEDTCGISILGGRIIRVSNNLLRRVKLHGIWVAADSLEGTNPIFGISITDNDIYDMLPTAPYPVNGVGNQLAIAVTGPTPVAGTLPSTTDGAIPGEYDATTGAIVPWYNYRDVNSHTSGTAMPNTYGIQISRNRIQRTLPAVANYSEWGHGQVISNGSGSGWLDPAVTDAYLRPYEGIGIATYGVGYMINDNQMWSTGEAISIVNNMVSNNSSSFMISRNQIYDVTTAAIRFHGGVDDAADGIIANNLFDLDPFFTHFNRTRPLDGTWNNTTDIQPSAIYGSFIDCVQFNENTIKNAMCVYQTILLDPRDNIIVCQPAGPGTNIANKGIQKLPTVGPGFRLQVRDSDPTSTTFGALLNHCPLQASARPTTGYYLQGHFVQSTGYTGVLGWYRLTSGSSHTLGVDWLPVNIGGATVGSTSAQLSCASTVASAGTTQSGATLLTANVNLVTSGPSNGGVRLPDLPSSGSPGVVTTIVWVYNSTGNTQNVYPQTGGGFRGSSAGVPVSLAASTSGAYAIAGNGQWLQLK